MPTDLMFKGKQTHTHWMCIHTLEFHMKINHSEKGKFKLVELVFSLTVSLLNWSDKYNCHYLPVSSGQNYSYEAAAQKSSFYSYPVEKK